MADTFYEGKNMAIVYKNILNKAILF